MSGFCVTRPQLRGPSGALKAYLKLSYTAGILIAASLIFYQLWAFIAAGLHAKEKRIALPFVLASTVLFVGGGLFGWRICFPMTFGYFLGLTGTAENAGVAIQPVMMMGPALTSAWVEVAVILVLTRVGCSRPELALSRIRLATQS
jgi:Sec-independent protein secretion pathway component TatC